MKACYIALTDINRSIEIDDIQSLLRLLIDSNPIDLEGLINGTSCFVKKTGTMCQAFGIGDGPKPKRVKNKVVRL